MDLLEYKSNIKSHDGEDGIIEQIFKTIGETNRFVVELGAINGVRNSNSWNLINNQGWSGVLMEADITYFEKLKTLYQGEARVTCLNEFVEFEGPSSIDAIFARTSLPRDFDLFSLDIDGNDYHVWESMREYKPRVLMVEYNPSIPNHVAFVQPRDMSIFQGSSLHSFIQLAKEKGYELVCASDPNAFFVLKELYPKFGIEDNGINALHVTTERYTYLYQLYDGTLKIDGCKTLLWSQKPIDEEKLQVLSPSERVYGARVSSSPWMRALKSQVRKLPVYPLLQKIRKSLRS